MKHLCCGCGAEFEAEPVAWPEAPPFCPATTCQWFAYRWESMASIRATEGVPISSWQNPWLIEANRQKFTQEPLRA